MNVFQNLFLEIVQQRIVINEAENLEPYAERSPIRSKRRSTPRMTRNTPPMVLMGRRYFVNCLMCASALSRPNAMSKNGTASPREKIARSITKTPPMRLIQIRDSASKPPTEPARRPRRTKTAEKPTVKKTAFRKTFQLPEDPPMNARYAAGRAAGCMAQGT